MNYFTESTYPKCKKQQQETQEIYSSEYKVGCFYAFLYYQSFTMGKDLIDKICTQYIAYINFFTRYIL